MKLPQSSLASSSRPRIGLVLGAGGIRGCAHAAVIQVLQEAGIPIDLVVGASVGAVFGLGVAAGVPADEISHRALSLTPLDMVRFYTARLRPTTSNRIGRLILETAGHRTFGDLALPYGVAVTDMSTHRPVLVHRGPLLPAIQASIAIPLIARPVRLGNSVYSDGGLVETAPIPFARQMGADLVIAVCLGGNYRAPAYARGRRARAVLERVGRQPGAVRGHLRDQIRFSSRLWLDGMDPTRPGTDADILIWPDFGRLSPNSPIGAHFCFAQGEAAARDAVPSILSAIVNHHIFRESP